ncbi:MAG: leucine-rich repeat protein, partial [Eubacteriales bacterium]|nr:leucine-rich repeat protein [Eubacteriales bacterium]
MRKKVLSAALSMMMIVASFTPAFGAEFSSGEEIETISEENKKADQEVNFSEQSGNKSSEDVFDFEAENFADNENEELSISEESGEDENLVSSPEELTDVFQSDGLYMEEEYKAALENASVSDVEDAAQIDWNISDGIESALGSESKVVDTGICGDEVYWELFDDGTLIIHGYGEMYGYPDDDSLFLTGKAAVISDGVTSIGYGAFRYCSSLSSVTIPSSVTSIEYEAFEGCSSLRSVTIPSSVTSIGE